MLSELVVITFLNLSLELQQFEITNITKTGRIKTLFLKYDMSLILDVTNFVYDLGMIN